MSNREEVPTIKVCTESWRDGQTEASHPAFGVCVVGGPSYGGGNKSGVRLFGSDLGHRTSVSLTFHEAALHRGLSSDRTHAGEVLLQVEMSQAQWAGLVSSSGIGAGTPVTLRYKRTGPLEKTPNIAAPVASKREVHGEEMAAALAEHLEAIKRQIDNLETHLAIGGTKRDLREVHKELKRHAEQLPGSVQFVYDQFARATEKVAEDAKTEVEAHVAGVAKSIGLDTLRGLAPTMLLPGARPSAEDGGA